MKRARIIKVGCDSQNGIVEKWVVFYNTGAIETYEDETPPAAVAKFCVRAKFGRKDFDDSMVKDWWSNTSLFDR